jgi:hypothetical protein
LQKPTDYQIVFRGSKNSNSSCGRVIDAPGASVEPVLAGSWSAVEKQTVIFLGRGPFTSWLLP